MKARHLATIAALSGALACSALSPPVARTVDGVTTEGRFIDPEAYALYAVAALREARGQWREALTLYQRAYEVDSHGPEIRTRIAAVACKLRQPSLADEAFEAAEAAAADYGPLWYERALCHKLRAELPQALQAALLSVRFDPERFEASLLAADLAEESANPSLAWQLRDGLFAHAPASLTVQRSLLAAARKSGDRARVARAEAALAALPQPAPATRSSGLSLAMQALERGELATAKLEVERLLGADPGNGDARLLALCVADLQQDHAAFTELLSTATESDAPSPISPELRSKLSALLGRRVSAQAAQLVQSH